MLELPPHDVFAAAPPWAQAGRRDKLRPATHLRFGGNTLQVKKALGWEPKVPLREGLARMVDDFTKRCGARAYAPRGRA